MGGRLNIHDIGESTAIIRLTALWALSEAGLGGLLHLFRTPFTGILVGGVAVVLISLMAYVSDKPYKTIPKALILVLIVKMSISPHSPIPAYMAVSFQGIMGALMFSILPSYRISCLLLGFLALVQSAVQKIITLTLIFGMSLWDSLDIFFDHVLHKFSLISIETSSDASFWFVISYLILYALAGLSIGVFAALLPLRINLFLYGVKAQEKLSLFSETETAGQKKKKSFWRSEKIKSFIGIFLAVILIYAFIPGSRFLIDPVWMIVRVMIILLVWYFLVAPLFLKLFQRFLNRKSSQYKEDVDKALSLIPVFRKMVFAVWKKNATLSGIRRMNTSLLQIIAYALIYKNDDSDA